MKAVKRIFYTLMVIVIAICVMILLCAVNPKMAQSVKTILYGDENVPGIIRIIDSWVHPNKYVGNTQTPAVGDSDNIIGNIPGLDDGFVVELPGDTDVVITLPADTSYMTGYIPAYSDEEKITDDVAEEIKKNLSTGETGEKLTFDTVFYPYYGMLSPDEQAVYKQIYANATALNSAFAPVKPISTSALKNVFEAVVNDHPELFYLETGYSVKYSEKKSVIEIKLNYYTLVNDIDSAKKKFDTAAKEILAGAMALSDDYAKEKYVHDALVQRVTYDEQALLNQSAYSALVNGRTVCAGYARANQYLMQQLKIPCYYCTGYSGEDHAWNIIRLSDGFYNEDATWDDTDPSTYDYFNRTDADIASTHVRTGMSVNLPRCVGTKFRGLESGSTSNVVAGNPSDVDDASHIKPMRYDEEYPETVVNENTDMTDEQKRAIWKAALEKIGVKEADAAMDLDEYYANCKKKLVAAGSGDQHFSLVVSPDLFSKIEKQYGNNEFEKGYVNDALKELDMNHFSIMIQAQRLGNGYYKLYHNVVTWKE